MTGPDFEALHYGLAPSTDWSAGTIHRARSAEPDSAEAADPADHQSADDADASRPADPIEGQIEGQIEGSREGGIEGEEGLGVPGTFVSAAPEEPLWGPTTYGGSRRNRPAGGRRRAPETPAEAADPVVENRPDLSGAAEGEPPSWDELLESDPAGHVAPIALDKPIDTPGELDAAPLGEPAAAAPDPATTAAPAAPSASAPSTTGLLTSSRMMAIASLASRVTGFLRTAAIAAALGVVGNGVADAYNLANMLPNMVYELLIGGVLSSVLIPLLVRAQENDPDQGDAYTHRLLSVATVALGLATLVAAAGAPVLTWLLVQAGPQRDLATIWATILLPEIFFYGVGALFTAVLNSRHVYGAPAWAPVLNNVIILLTVAVYLLLPGPATLTPTSITDAQVLVLGIGTTLGIVAQAAVLLPALRKAGFRWVWRFSPPAHASAGSRGFAQERGLVGWVLGYVAVSQLGLLVISRVALANDGLTTFASADLLFQVPYGILGVSLLTALMPRLSRSAARGDYTGVLADLSLGARLSALALVPVTAGLIVLGPALGTVIFNYGQTPLGDARHVGIVLALASFGLFPFAVVMLQLRVFYAMQDARTPTLINIGMVTAKVVLVLGAAAALDGRHVVEALSVATSASYVVGAVLGHLALERRLGALGLGSAVPTVAKVAGASAVGAVVAWLVAVGIEDVLGRGRFGALATVVLGSALGGGALVAILWRLRLAEVQEIVAALRPGAGRGARPESRAP